MQITFLGHAGALVRAGDVTLACDPWFTLRGAFVASWFQQPANHHLADRLDAATHVYVSHHHRDHFDEDVLNKLDPGVPVLVPDFGLPSWNRMLDGLKCAPPTRLADRATVAVGDLRLTLHLSPTVRHLDSALVIEDTATSQVAVNLNDCQLDPRQLDAIRTEHPRIDVVMGQYSGATWFPFVYDFPDELRARLAVKKRVNSIRRWLRTMTALEPRHAVAFAGPPVLLDPELVAYNSRADSIFTTPEELLDHLRREAPAVADRTITPWPGDTLTIDDGVLRQVLRELAPVPEEYAARMAPHLAAELARYPEPTGDLFPAFQRHFQDLFDAAPDSCRAVDAAVAFHITGTGGGRWLVDFRDLTVRRTPDGDDGNHDYRFTVASRFLPSVFAHEQGWEELFFSFRFQAWRPAVNAYNEELMTVLRYSCPDDLVFQEHAMAVERAEPTGFFTIDTPTGTYRVQNRCPHNGATLGPENYDRALDAVVCGQHGWIYALQDGRCSNGRARLIVTSENGNP